MPTLLAGGFDPIALAAAAGDTVDVAVIDMSGKTSHSRVGVAANQAPRVIRISPQTGATDVALASVVVVVFSEPIDAATLNAASVQLRTGAAAVSGTLSFGDDAHLTVTFAPDLPLAPTTYYEVDVTPDVRDLEGQSPDSPVSVEFSTISEIIHDTDDGQMAFHRSSARSGRTFAMNAAKSAVTTRRFAVNHACVVAVDPTGIIPITAARP